MRIINTLLSLAPAPLFYLGAVVSFMSGAGICTASWFGSYEMTIMWFVMGLAHTGNWLVYLERRRYSKLQHLPVKQQ